MLLSLATISDDMQLSLSEYDNNSHVSSRLSDGYITSIINVYYRFRGYCLPVIVKVSLHAFTTLSSYVLPYPTMPIGYTIENRSVLDVYWSFSACVMCNRTMHYIYAIPSQMFAELSMMYVMSESERSTGTDPEARSSL